MFAGVIFARDEAPDAPGSLVATLPFAGATLVETQLARLRAAGASRLFVVAARVTPALTAALDRQRGAGTGVELVRRPAELAGMLGADELLLIVADGIVASEDVLATVASGSAPTLLALADAPQGTRLERIDPHDHWAGLALIDAALLARTLDALGDWDLQSTLLRRAAQAGATRRYLAPGAGEADFALIGTAREAQGVDAARMSALIAGHGRFVDRPVSRWLAGPLAELVQRHGVAARPIAIGAAVLGGAGIVVAAIGWLATGALSVLLAVFALAAARIGFWHAFDDRAAGVVGRIADGLALALIAAAAVGLRAPGGDAPVALPVATIAALVLARRARGDAWSWAPTPASVVALLALCAVIGNAQLGMVLVAAHASASLVRAIERLRGGKQG